MWLYFGVISITLVPFWQNTVLTKPEPVGDIIISALENKSIWSGILKLFKSTIWKFNWVKIDNISFSFTKFL